MTLAYRTEELCDMTGEYCSRTIPETPAYAEKHTKKGTAGVYYFRRKRRRVYIIYTGTGDY